MTVDQNIEAGIERIFLDLFVTAGLPWIERRFSIRPWPEGDGTPAHRRVKPADGPVDTADQMALL